MKKLFFFVIPILVSFLFFSCDDKDLIEDYSQDASLSDIKFTELTNGVKINFSEKIITLAISRDCPDIVILNADLPSGAKIIQVSDGLELKTNVTFKVSLSLSEQFFIVQAQDENITEKYAVNIVMDKTDVAVHLIEQILQKDGAYKWKHERDDSGAIIASKLVNISNEKNIKTFDHESNESGFITKTIFTTYEHKKYSYTWKYDNSILTSYDKQFFNNLPTHYFININADNLITKVEQKNDFDYIVNEVTYKYDNNILRELKDIKASLHHTYSYDENNRIISDGQYSYAYDAKGNILSKISLDGNYMYQYTYNDIGQIATERNTNYTRDLNYSYYENGRVRKLESVGSNYYLEYNEDGSYISYSNFSDVHLLESTYDINHNLIEEIDEYVDSNDPINNDKTVRTYDVDENSLIIKRTITTDNKDGSSISTNVTDFEYNYKNQIIKRIYTTDGEIRETDKIEYNSNGLITEIAFYDPENMKTGAYTYTYTQFGLRVKMTLVGSTNGYRHESIKEYDSEWRRSKETAKWYRNNIISSEKVKEYYASQKQKSSDEKSYDAEGNLESRTVIEYYETGGYKSKIVYDADGNIIFSQTYEEQNSIRPRQEELDRNLRLDF